MTLIQFDTAKLAKEKKCNLKTINYFDSEKDLIITIKDEEEDCINIPINHNAYKNTWSRPTQSELQKWIRDVHNIHICIDVINMGYIEYQWSLYDLYNEKFIKESFKSTGSSYVGAFETYEKALEEALLEALKLIENGNN